MTDANVTERLAVLERRVASLEKTNAALLAALGGKTGAVSSGEVATDAELDSKYGDSRIRFGLKAKYWPQQPDPNVGKLWSECDPEYLDATAKYLEAYAFMAAKGTSEEDKKKARYRSADAARARGWARRIRAGWKPPKAPAVDSSFGDSAASDWAPDADDGTSFDFGANVEDPL